MILITGASGTAGGATLQEAQQKGAPVRAMYRSKDDARKAPPGVPIAIADFADRESLRSALNGIDTVFIVCAPISQLVELESNMIDACREAGVRRIVLHSALGAGKYNKSFPSWHTKVEQKLTASGIDYTILRPNGFMQNIITYNAPTIRAQNAFYDCIGDARISLIDARDIGAAAAEALVNPAKHGKQTYELNGPEALSNYDVADRLSRALGRKVSYVAIPEEAQRKAMLGAGMPAEQVTAILDLMEYYHTGACATVDSTLENIIGREPRTLDAFLSENADSFRQSAATA
jgi:uncharacterized protein YbjT (DUF2867 family)